MIQSPSPPPQKIAVSVIIPIFNVKEYLPRCLDSVVSQTIKNIEIILVDDGSTDGSESICDNYARNDNRIKVFHEKNSGMSIARNKGIDNALGEYLAFVDSDDEIQHDFCEKLFKTALKEQSDVCKGDMKIIKPNHDVFVAKSNQPIRINKSKLFFMFFCLTAIYKKDFLIKNKIRFMEYNNFGESALFVNQVVLNTDRISLVDDVYYIVHPRKGSTTSGIFTEQKLNSAIYSFSQITDNININIQSLDQKGVVYVYFLSIKHVLMLISKLKDTEKLESCFKCADSIYKKCPYRSDLKKTLIKDLNANNLQPKISLLKQKRVRIPSIILDIAYKYRHRKRIIRIIIKLLVNRKRYKKLKKHPDMFFNDSKSWFIRLLGRYYNPKGQLPPPPSIDLLNYFNKKPPISNLYGYTTIFKSLK